MPGLSALPCCHVLPLTGVMLQLYCWNDSVMLRVSASQAYRVLTQCNAEQLSK